MDLSKQDIKVYIITKQPFPQGMAATKRILCYAKGLVSNHMNCNIIITKRTEISTSYKNRSPKGVFENVQYQYIPTSTLRSNNFIKRRIDDFLTYWSTIFFCITKISSKDYMHLFLPFGWTYITILILSKLKGIKITRELCEYPCATRNDSLYNRIMRQIDLRICFPAFTGFIVISNELEKVAKQYGASRASIIKIPILIDDNANKEMYIHNKPYIFHGGTMYERKDAIISTMNAFAMSAKKMNYSIDFILIGPPSPHQKELNKIIKENHLENNVIFKGQLSNQEVIRYQNGASLSILNKNDNIQNRCGFSTKLGEILMSRTPVITTTIGEANYYLKNGESAYIVEPHHPELIAQKIIQAFTNNKERVYIGENGYRIAIKYFNYTYQGKRFKEYILNLESNQ